MLGTKLEVQAKRHDVVDDHAKGEVKEDEVNEKLLMPRSFSESETQGSTHRMRQA